MNINAVPLGIAITLAAGFLQGSFALFLKTKEPWKWENFWLVYSLVALVVFPFVWALIAIPKLGSILVALPPNSIALPLLFGALWGIGSVLFGLSVVRLGLSITYGIVISLTAVLGTIIPFFMNGPSLHTIVIVTIGLVVMVVGTIISGYAGIMREALQGKGKKSTIWVGYALAIASGITSPMLNIGFAAGKPISEVSMKFGASSANATLPIWIIVLFGGFVINIGYALYLLGRNNSFRFFLYRGVRPLGSSILSGLFWFGAFGLFGIATLDLGKLGGSVGWSLLMGTMIVISSCWGFLTGEWKGARRPLQIQIASVLVLVVGIAVTTSALFH